MNLFAIHGFLGMAKDWDLFQFETLNTRFHAVDLFTPGSAILPFNTWANNFINDLSQIGEKNSSILMGYSLGGRLLLHVLKENYQTFKAAIFISTNLGLSSEEEKKERLIKDLEWKNAFLHEPWEKLMKTWNQQPIFKNDNFNFKRKEENFSRNSLANSLSTWSLGRQNHFKKELEAWNIPILWIVGKNDLKYAKEATELNLFHKKSKIWIAKECGHRVPWQNKKEFIATLTNFFNNLEEK